MKIYIDADGCPVVDESIAIAKEFSLEVIVVKNYAHDIKDLYATIISVDISRDSADFYIANAVKKGDIVVTQDYGLAAMCLSKEAIPINQNGIIYSNDNIDGMLNRRYLHQQLRKQKIYHSKAKKRGSESDRNFIIKLRQLIHHLP